MYKLIRSKLLLSIAFFTLAIAHISVAQETPTSRIKLFDGKSLNGLYTWLTTTGYNDPNNVFRPENGLLHISGNGLGYLATHKNYQNFHMILEFKWGTETYEPRKTRTRDGGLLIHGNGKDGGGQKGKAMSALQSQIIEGGMGGLIIIPGTDNNGNLLPQSITVETEWVPCPPTSPYGCWHDYPAAYRWKAGGDSVTLNEWDLIHSVYWDPNWKDIKGFRGANTLENPTGDWNQMVVIANGDKVEVYLNGVKVNEATNVFPTSGRIHVQVEWAEMFVRRWELWPVGQAPSPTNPASSGGGAPSGPPNTPTNVSVTIQ